MQRIAFLALMAAGVFWGLGFPLGKFAMQEAPAAHTVLLRFVVAALAALPFAVKTPEARALFRCGRGGRRRALRRRLHRPVRGPFARQRHPGGAAGRGHAGLIAVSARLLGERVTAISWAGVAAATLGAALIAGKPEVQARRSAWPYPSSRC